MSEGEMISAIILMVAVILGVAAYAYWQNRD
jgi:uncharacterized protein HemX